MVSMLLLLEGPILWTTSASAELQHLWWVSQTCLKRTEGNTGIGPALVDTGPSTALTLPEQGKRSRLQRPSGRGDVPGREQGRSSNGPEGGWDSSKA